MALWHVCLFTVITLYNRQRKHRLPLKELRAIARSALPAVLVAPAGTSQQPLLGELEEIEVTFVSDAAIARLHRDFMNIPGATDVITFQHGEVIISAETAWENARYYKRSFLSELALYIIHGLLHLNGYNDLTPEEREGMHSLQDQILADCAP